MMLDNPVDILPQKINTRDRLILSALIGFIICLISIYIYIKRGAGAGDLSYSLLLARDWLINKDPYLPYKLNIDPTAVPYPFTAVVLTMPLIWLPNHIAAGIFFGLGSGILAWFIFTKGVNWQLLLFFSWPFVNSLIFVQWSPYNISMYFAPSLLFLLFVKPQNALPFVLTQKPNRIGIILAAILVIASVALYPLWPLD